MSEPVHQARSTRTPAEPGVTLQYPTRSRYIAEPASSEACSPTWARLPSSTRTRRARSAEVKYDLSASRQLDSYERAGFGHLPVCVAKTHLSISSDPQLRGAPTGWVLPVREVRASVGAGFIYAICGEMRTMPGLTANSAAERIDIDANGEVVGLA